MKLSSTTSIILLVVVLASCSASKQVSQQYVSKPYTEINSFTAGAEGPAVDVDGTLYAVNYAKEGTVGKITKTGAGSVFVELPNKSVGNGIRFNSKGEMLIADYTNHNILKVNMTTKQISTYANEPTMSQPNDIAITSKDRLFASDPNWAGGTGRIWTISTDGKVSLLEKDMGTTNGIEVSPNDKTLYVNESVQRKVWAYDLADDGTLSNKRLLIEFPDFGMDGMRCDVSGNLYIARWGKGTVAKVSPTGELLKEIVLSGKLPSNIAFGGDDGRTVFVTLQDAGNIESFQVDKPGREWKMIRRK